MAWTCWLLHCHEYLLILKRKYQNPYFVRILVFSSINRSDVIRTRDLYVPNVALYQAEPHSANIDRTLKWTSIRRPCQGTTEKGFEPLLTESESAVLPLHHSAMFLANMYYYNNFFKKIKTFFTFFSFFSLFEMSRKSWTIIIEIMHKLYMWNLCIISTIIISPYCNIIYSLLPFNYLIPAPDQCLNVWLARQL